MLNGKETGIGPAIRVLRHFIERRRFYQLKFTSGEQALVLVDGMPSPSVEIVRLALGGLLPWQTVWEYNPTRAGGYSDYMHKLKAMFSPATERSEDSAHYIPDTLGSCRSIEDARMLLLQRERLAESSTNNGPHAFARRELRSTTHNDGWELGIDYTRHEPAAETIKPAETMPNDERLANGNAERLFAENLDQAKNSTVPNRYRMTQGSMARLLTCVEAPTVMIRAERRLAISAKQARKYPAGTFFLDGAAQGDPFIDVEKELYNLNHPEGCIQSLATCEQAMVLIRKGLDLGKRDWLVLANDSDLDTVFAIWVLLNHRRLNDDAEVRAKVMPLLRLEGVIDAHGPQSQYLSALPPDLLRSTAEIRKQLQQQELILKNYGWWSETDLLEYIADRLRAIDAVIYAPENFAGLLDVNELARAEIASGSVAVVCGSDGGMDAVEGQLRRIYGQRLGLLVFQVAPSNYKVRQIDSSLPAMLGQAYERLNLLDPAATSGAENRWGGSGEIGYSPRQTGTSLTPAQIIDAVRQSFWKPTVLDAVSEFPRALFLAGGALLPALAVIFIGNLLRSRGYAAGAAVPLAALILAVTTVILFCSKARLVPGLCGWRIPTGSSWLGALPAAFIGGAIGGVWGCGSLAYRIGAGDLYLFTGLPALLFPLAAELLFRGVVLGQLAARLPMQKSAGAWSNSWPNKISTVLYAAASLLLFLMVSPSERHLSQSLFIVGGAVIFGISSGIARERSESVLPCVLLHWGCAATLLLFHRLLF